MTRAKLTISNTAKLAIGAAAIAGLAACGGSERPRTELAAAQINTIGVNAYLWRGALETLSFAPMASADSGGGLFWHCVCGHGVCVSLLATLRRAVVLLVALRGVGRRMSRELWTRTCRAVGSDGSFNWFPCVVLVARGLTF